MSRMSPKTIKLKVISIMVAFTLLVTVLIGAISLYSAQTFVQRSLIQATEFNLQLVAGLVSQDMENLDYLAKWCGSSSEITGYLSSTNQDRWRVQAMEAFERQKEEFQNSQSSLYVRRMIVTDGGEKLLQVGNMSTDNSPVTPYSLYKLGAINRSVAWESIETDPFAPPQSLPVIPIVEPITPQSGAQVGWCYLAVSTGIILNRLANYRLSDGNELYISLGEKTYQIIDGGFQRTDYSYQLVRQFDGVTLSPRTLASLVELEDGSRRITISCPTSRHDIRLLHSLSPLQMDPYRSTYFQLGFTVCTLLLGLGIFISYYISHTIDVPVTRLRRKMRDISKGDFSRAPEIEWNNELGEIGRGINELSRDVATLMDKRIADEKQKRDLEYQMLLSQINPHFIYNTLNSIKWMATVQNAEGIAEMTGAFASMLKNISKSTSQMIPLREELMLVDSYFLIQRYRYGGTISMDTEIEEASLCDCILPRFSLQPLVENAIFHGIEPKGGAGKIALRVYSRNEAELVVEIADDGVGMSDAMIAAVMDGGGQPPGMFKQVGIRNVHERIRYAFGEEYGVSITSVRGEYTRMCLIMPKTIAPQRSEDIC